MKFPAGYGVSMRPDFNGKQSLADDVEKVQDTEAEEIVAEANDFFELVEHWIAANHPKLNP